MSEITLTIDEQGDILCLDTESAQAFKELGTVETKRASYVEPAGRYERWLFTIIRAVVPDDSRLAEWTRGWDVSWRIDTHPVGGPLLRWKYLLPEGSESIATFSNRQAAIDAEIDFLNRWFLER